VSQRAPVGAGGQSGGATGSGRSGGSSGTPRRRSPPANAPRARVVHAPPGAPLAGAWFGGRSDQIAPQLLNKVVATRRPDGWRWARIVEVEAYAWHDPASHSYGGRRARNAVMYGPPGFLYVYFTYGMHWCANVVTGPAGSGQAVLLRAGEPLGGLEAMTRARGGHVPVRQLCRGPARLAQALGLTGDDNGCRLVSGRRRPIGSVLVLDDGTPPPTAPAVGPRVGITKAIELPWRWWVPDSAWVSPFRPGRRASADEAGPSRRGAG
jgi:DNA-3-methyladenine glycosylase